MVDLRSGWQASAEYDIDSADINMVGWVFSLRVRLPVNRYLLLKFVQSTGSKKYFQQQKRASIARQPIELAE